MFSSNAKCSLLFHVVISQTTIINVLTFFLLFCVYNCVVNNFSSNGLHNITFFQLERLTEFTSLQYIHVHRIIPKRFRSNISRHCALIIYRVKTQFKKRHVTTPRRGYKFENNVKMLESKDYAIYDVLV